MCYQIRFSTRAWDSHELKETDSLSEDSCPLKCKIYKYTTAKK